MYKDRNFDSVFMRENTGQRKLIFYHSLRSDDDELIVSVGWLTHEHFQKGVSSGSLIIMTFQHIEVGTEHGSLKQESVLLPLHHGATEFQNIDDLHTTRD